MTIWEMTRVLLRRWFVVLVGAAATVAIGMGPLRGQSVVFARSELAFLAPVSSDNPNTLRTTSDDVISTAGIVARRVTGPGRVAKFASPEVTLIGQGVRDGWSLRLPDTGGQWAPNFASQELTLEIVGPSVQEVQRRQTELISRVRNELSALQEQFGVSERNRVSVIEAPTKSSIYTVSGNPHRAQAAIGVLGAAATIMAALFVDGFRRAKPSRCGALLSRRWRRRPKPPRGGTA
ncbi:hypothetical protein [Calidifontibacter indicus]|uniref:hypothetical protein n=1 Tax=Calidifontibacter indicus TaxID=419650 RepID=UPI003D725FD1